MIMNMAVVFSDLLYACCEVYEYKQHVFVGMVLVVSLCRFVVARCLLGREHQFVEVVPRHPAGYIISGTCFLVLIDSLCGSSEQQEQKKKGHQQDPKLSYKLSTEDEITIIF